MPHRYKCKNHQERNGNVVIFMQLWYDFQWNVFVTGVLNLREYKHKDDLHPKCLQEVM